MSFKNSFKIFLSRFSLVWVLCIYTIIAGGLIALLSLPFVSIIFRTIREAGIGDEFAQIYRNLLEGATLSNIAEQLALTFKNFIALFTTNKTLSVASSLLILVVVIFAFRFLTGLYELPLINVLDNYMSSNAKTGFAANFISNLGKSSLFSLVKMLYTILADVVILAVIRLLWLLFTVPVLAFFTPFIIMICYIVLIALKSAFMSAWAPAIINGNMPIFKAFAFSIKNTLKNFKSVFGNLIITWLFIIALNVFIGIFTFGAGLIATIPISMLFICILNLTLYYNKNNKRYYIDDAVFTPPVVL